MFDASFWGAVGFGILILLIGNPFWRFLVQLLDQHKESIRRDIKEAALLKRTADQELAQAQVHHQNIATQAKEILKHADLEVQRLEEDLALQLASYHQAEEQRIQARLQYMERHVATDIKQQTLQMALAVAEHVVQETIGPDQDKEMIHETLDYLSTLKTPLRA